MMIVYFLMAGVRTRSASPSFWVLSAVASVSPSASSLVKGSSKGISSKWGGMVTCKYNRKERDKKRYYKKHGKTRVWRKKEKKVQQVILEAKRLYIERVKKRIIEEGNTKCYFQAVKILSSFEAPTKWKIQSMLPGKTDLEIAEEAAEFFNSISRTFEPLDPLIGPIKDQSHLCPELHEVAQRLRYMKKPKSTVADDIDPRLITKFSDLIAVPVHMVFYKSFQTQEWPQLWASETVSLIPKNNNPEDFSELRNISCTPLFSKCLEGFVLAELKKKIKLSDFQYGGKKGVGVDHFLIDTWDSVMSGLEDPRACMTLMSIDFRKAFNTMCHKNCLTSLERLGAEPAEISMVAAFLRNRLMRVKVGKILSTPRLVPGGAPQGSVLGSFLFCASTDRLGTDLRHQGQVGGQGGADISVDFSENGLDMSTPSRDM